MSRLLQLLSVAAASGGVAALECKTFSSGVLVNTATCDANIKYCLVMQMGDNIMQTCDTTVCSTYESAGNAMGADNCLVSPGMNVLCLPVGLDTAPTNATFDNCATCTTPTTTPGPPTAAPTPMPPPPPGCNVSNATTAAAVVCTDKGGADADDGFDDNCVCNVGVKTMCTGCGCYAGEIDWFKKSCAECECVTDTRPTTSTTTKAYVDNSAGCKSFDAAAAPDWTCATDGCVETMEGPNDACNSLDMGNTMKLTCTDSGVPMITAYSCDSCSGVVLAKQQAPNCSTPEDGLYTEGYACEKLSNGKIKAMTRYYTDTACTQEVTCVPISVNGASSVALSSSVLGAVLLFLLA